MIHRTTAAQAQPHSSGWVRLPSGVEVTKLPLVDSSQSGLFARLDYDSALEVAKREGAELIHEATVIELQRLSQDGSGRALGLVPYLGTPRAENEIEHSRLHDQYVADQLKARAWNGLAPVANAGKHWIHGAPAGKSRLMGWDKDGDGPGVGFWQPASVAHNRKHFDDGTTTMLQRRPRGAALAAEHHHVNTGYVAPAEIPFVRSKNFRAGRTAPVRLVVLHTIEIVEIAAAAERCAQYFATVTKPQVSAHYCVDSDSAVQCVLEEDTAFTAPGANHDGVHIEMAGYARQNAAEWSDPYSAAMLERVAALVAEICDRHGVPAELVEVPGLLSGARGITTHGLVSKAFKKSNHTDPGPHFPMGAFLMMVRAKMCGNVPAPDMPAPPPRELTYDERIRELGFADAKAFQRAHPPLVVDGIVGKNTRAVVDSLWISRRGS